MDGTVDGKDADEANKPVLELYTKNRPSWCGVWHGAAQKEVS